MIQHDLKTHDNPNATIIHGRIKGGKKGRSQPLPLNLFLAPLKLALHSPLHKLTRLILMFVRCSLSIHKC